jgi:hypothetical protein
LIVVVVVCAVLLVLGGSVGFRARRKDKTAITKIRGEMNLVTTRASRLALENQKLEEDVRLLQAYSEKEKNMLEDQVKKFEQVSSGGLLTDSNVR